MTGAPSRPTVANTGDDPPGSSSPSSRTWNGPLVTDRCSDVNVNGPNAPGTNRSAPRSSGGPPLGVNPA